MATKDPLNEFVRDALVAGRSRDELSQALKDAGWSDREIRDALAQYADTAFSPPVPRPRLQLTARDAFVYAILFTALAYTAFSLISLVHAVLDIRLPDPSDDSYASVQATGQLRWAIANLIIATPVYIWMTIYTNRQIARDPGYRRSLVRNWLTYLALFIAVLVFLGDAIFVVYSFLNGEATLRFILKAITVAAVAAAVFLFYLRDVVQADNAE